MSENAERQLIYPRKAPNKKMRFTTSSDKNSSFEISNDNAYLIKDDEQYLLYVNDQYIATITDLDSDPNLKNLKILSK